MQLHDGREGLEARACGLPASDRPLDVRNRLTCLHGMSAREEARVDERAEGDGDLACRPTVPLSHFSARTGGIPTSLRC